MYITNAIIAIMINKKNINGNMITYINNNSVK